MATYTEVEAKDVKVGDILANWGRVLDRDTTASGLSVCFQFDNHSKWNLFNNSDVVMKNVDSREVMYQIVTNNCGTMWLLNSQGVELSEFTAKEEFNAPVFAKIVGRMFLSPAAVLDIEGGF